MKMKLYHGTYARFEEFNMEMVGYSYGENVNNAKFYFCGEIKPAARYGQYVNEYELELNTEEFQLVSKTGYSKDAFKMSHDVQDSSCGFDIVRHNKPTGSVDKVYSELSELYTECFLLGEDFESGFSRFEKEYKEIKHDNGEDIGEETEIIIFNDELIKKLKFVTSHNSCDILKK